MVCARTLREAKPVKGRRDPLPVRECFPPGGGETG